MPDVYGHAGPGGAVIGDVLQCQLDRDRDTFGCAGVGAEARSDVAADNARLDENVRPVRPVTGIGARGLGWRGGHAAGRIDCALGRGARNGGAVGPGGTSACTGRDKSGGARCTGEVEHPASGEHLQVVGQAEVVFVRSAMASTMPPPAMTPLCACCEKVGVLRAAVH